MTMWRMERWERHPESDPDPVTAAVTVVFRDQDTGFTATERFGVPKADLLDPAALIGDIHDTWGSTYTPNDFNWSV